MNITGIVITLNEEKNIVECINSLKLLCDDIVVVDSGSVDDTCRLAQELGATVVKQSYLGDGPQKNVGLAYAKNEWVFSLDADERIMPELVEEIKRMDIDNGGYDAYAVRRRNYVGSRWIKCCHWYPNYLVRLYRKDRARYCDSQEHAHVEVERFKKIKADILHYPYKSIAKVFEKQVIRFSSRGAKIVYRKGRRVNKWMPMVHGVNMFFLNYIVRGGIWGGIDGLSISIAMSMNTYLKYARVVEYNEDEEVKRGENFDNIW